MVHCHQCGDGLRLLVQGVRMAAGARQDPEIYVVNYVSLGMASRIAAHVHWNNIVSSRNRQNWSYHEMCWHRGSWSVADLGRAGDILHRIPSPALSLLGSSRLDFHSYSNASATSFIVASPGICKSPESFTHCSAQFRVIIALASLDVPASIQGTS